MCLPSSSSNLSFAWVCSKGTSGADKHIVEHPHVGAPRLVPQELEVDLVMIVPHRQCLVCADSVGAGGRRSSSGRA